MWGGGGGAGGGAVCERPTGNHMKGGGGRDPLVSACLIRPALSPFRSSAR